MSSSNHQYDVALIQVTHRNQTLVFIKHFNLTAPRSHNHNLNHTYHMAFKWFADMPGNDATLGIDDKSNLLFILGWGK